MPCTIENVVRRFIAESFMYRENVASLGDDDSLIEKGLIDSTGVLELVAFIEKHFGIKVKDEEVVPENLDSVNRIANYVRGQVQSSPSAAARVA